MTPRPLVREIEEAYHAPHDGSVDRLYKTITAASLIDNPYWPRIRAALETAEIIGPQDKLDDPLTAHQIAAAIRREAREK